MPVRTSMMFILLATILPYLPAVLVPHVQLRRIFPLAVPHEAPFVGWTSLRSAREWGRSSPRGKPLYPYSVWVPLAVCPCVPQSHEPPSGLENGRGTTRISQPVVHL